MIKKLFIAFILAICINSPAFCEEASWDEFNIDQNSFDTYKPVTKEEFNNAINSLKNKDKKIKDKNKTKKNIQVNEHNNDKLQFINNDHLLRLPYDLYYNDKIIPKGFYTISLYNNNDDDYYYISFIQGNSLITNVKMDKPDETFCENEINCLKSCIVDDKFYKLYFKNIDISLVKYFYIKF